MLLSILILGQSVVRSGSAKFRQAQTSLHSFSLSHLSQTRELNQVPFCLQSTSLGQNFSSCEQAQKSELGPLEKHSWETQLRDTYNRTPEIHQRGTSETLKRHLTSLLDPPQIWALVSQAVSDIKLVFPEMLVHLKIIMTLAGYNDIFPPKGALYLTPPG